MHDPIKMQGEIEGGVYELKKREKEQKIRIQQAAFEGNRPKPRMGERLRAIKRWDARPVEASISKKRRLASLSTP
jgi:hypothetical protein